MQKILLIALPLIITLWVGKTISEENTKKDFDIKPITNNSAGDKLAPDFYLFTLEGNLVSLSDYAGKIVILDFWATWCGPCRMAMPVIDEFTKNLNGDDIRVFSIDVWEKGKKGPKKFMDEHNYAMTLLYGNNDLTQAYGIQGIPFLCVIDKEGNIRYKQTGYEDGLDEKLIFWTEDLLHSN